jgi:hypothetical protein
MAGNIGVFGIPRSSFLPEDKEKPSAQSLISAMGEQAVHNL